MRQQSSDWSMQLQGLQEELQREKEDRGAEMKETVEGHQQESAVKLRPPPDSSESSTDS